jgi:hypothetical protein
MDCLVTCQKMSCLSTFQVKHKSDEGDMSITYICQCRLESFMSCYVYQEKCSEAIGIAGASLLLPHSAQKLTFQAS